MNLAQKIAILILVILIVIIILVSTRKSKSSPNTDRCGPDQYCGPGLICENGDCVKPPRDVQPPEPPALCQLGARDTTWEATFLQTMTTLVPGYQDYPKLFTQPISNKMILNTVGSPSSRLYRFNDDGTIDTTFGTAGVLDIPGGRSVGFDDTGAIYVADGASIGLTTVIRKFTINGVVDSSFGTAGTLNLTDFTIYGAGFAITIIQDPNGNMYIGGISLSPLPIRYAVFKFTTAGVIDTSFGTNSDGKVYFEDSLISPSIFRNYLNREVALAFDGTRIVALCQTEDVNAPVLIGITLAGTIDTSFGTNGVTILDAYLSDCPERNDDTWGLNLRSVNGAVYAAYTVYTSDGNLCPLYAALIKTIDGIPDPTFGTSGIAKILEDPLSYEVLIRGMIIRPDGSIFLGNYWNHDPFGATLVALNPDGTLNTNFDTDGVFSIHPPVNPFDYLPMAGLHEDSDGNIIMVYYDRDEGAVYKGVKFLCTM